VATRAGNTGHSQVAAPKITVDLKLFDGVKVNYFCKKQNFTAPFFAADKGLALNKVQLFLLP
jgi:hypothetical protein